jgi:sulfide:quinone oxidoreductase
VKRVIICGAGFGGIGAAVALRRRVPSNAQLQIALIDRRTDFVMGFRKTWAALGIEPLELGRRSLHDISGVDVVTGEITRIDARARQVEVDGRTISGDVLVLALGAQQASGALPGLAEFGLNVWDRDRAAETAPRLAGLRRGRLLIGIFGLPYTCPPAPYELALLCRERLGDAVEINVFTPAPIALPVVGPAQSAKIERLLADGGIGFWPDRKATEVSSEGVTFADGSVEPFDELLVVPLHRVTNVLVEAGLAAAGGWLTPDPRTLELADPDTYAVGDCTAITLANGLQLPKAGVFAHSEGEVVAARIAARLAGEEPTATFDGTGHCYIETGGGRAARAEGRFLADPPEVRISEPSEATMADKLDFERSRLTAWFGAGEAQDW